MKKNIIKEKNNWIICDAENKILGRFASKIALKLMGKDKVNYSPNVVNGSQIIIINSKKIKITGNKLKNKIYYKHTGFPGGLRFNNLSNILNKNPNFILKNAVKGMLPKNKLQKILLKRLKIYPNEKHLHIAQQPKNMDL